MGRTLTVRPPTAREMHWLEIWLEEEHPVQVQRRAVAILYYGFGWDGQAIAKALQVHPNTIYADLQAFGRDGLACLHSLPVGGAPPRITTQQLAQLWEWAERLPSEFGLLDTRWTLASFRDFVVHRQRLLKQLSLEHLRRLLKKRTFAFGASSANWLVKTRSVQPFWPVFVRCFSTCRPTES